MEAISPRAAKRLMLKFYGASKVSLSAGIFFGLSLKSFQDDDGRKSWKDQVGTHFLTWPQLNDSTTAISGGATTGAGQNSGGTYYFAGGGGGGGATAYGQPAGTAGVGNGAVNTGGGGVGSSSSGSGGSGYSGIFIVRYTRSQVGG